MRKKGYEHLPPNLYPHPNGGFRYKGDEWEYWSVAEHEAIAKANRLNAVRPSKDFDSVSRVIAAYKADLRARGNNRESTLAVKESILNIYARAWKNIAFCRVTRKALMNHWKKIGPHGWQKHRVIWIGLYKFAIANGWAESNEAEKTLLPPNLERKRQRHTLEGYNAIYEKADDWLQIAMELAVSSLQDRSTLCAALRADYDDGIWQCIRPKTGARLAIKVAPATRLHTALERAMSAPVFGSHLIRRDPTRRVTRPGMDFSAVTPDYLSKAFAKARAGVYDLPADEQPGFHDLRALGSWLYKKAGYPAEYVQALMAHSDKAMTAHYQEGHETPYTEVEAGL
tara:strand:- start:461 stop:1483 length:1023 start_codon:yes stop_codon:yes gene_type:complete